MKVQKKRGYNKTFWQEKEKASYLEFCFLIGLTKYIQKNIKKMKENNIKNFVEVYGALAY